MSWAGKSCASTSPGTVKSEPLNMEWARAGLPSRGLAPPSTSSRRSTQGRSAVAGGQQDHLGHRPADRHHGLHRRPLHRRHQGPLTGAIACSNSGGGYWGAELKMAGWDMVIFEGKSAKPVFLYINDDTAELRDASHLGARASGKPRRRS